MEYVFSGFNLTNLILAVVFCGLVFMLRWALRKWWSDGLTDAERYDTDWAAVHRREKILDRVLMPVFVLPFVAVISLGAAHVPQRTTQIELHKELAALVNVVQDAADLRFTEQCSFNGFLVDAGTRAAVVHPCNTFGDYRIWRTTMNKLEGDRLHSGEHFHIGVPEGKYMRELLTVNFGVTDFSTLGMLPQHRSSMSAEKAREVRKAIRSAMPVS